MEVRAIHPEEHERLGDIVVQAYAAIDPIGLGDYEAELRDVSARVGGAAVLVAVDGDGEVLGGVTYVGDPASPLAEFREPDAAGIRMLAVAPEAQGRGAGRALTLACVERARVEGKAQVVLHSTDWMMTARRLYERLGFQRDASIDWEPERDFWLRGFRLRL